MNISGTNVCHIAGGIATICWFRGKNDVAGRIWDDGSSFNKDSDNIIASNIISESISSWDNITIIQLAGNNRRDSSGGGK